jgi:hypothetical protein
LEASKMGATAGGSKDLPSATERRKTRLIKAVFLAVAAVSIVGGAAWLADARDALFGGGRAPGTIVYFSNDLRFPKPVIRYRVGGQEYLCQARSSSLGYHIGQGVTIRYHPDRPGGGRLDTFTELWLLPLFLLGFGTFLGLGIVFGKTRI